MRLTHSRSRISALAMLLVFAGLFVSANNATAQGVKHRDIMDFVNAQGTFDAGFLIIPPVPNFLGASDPVSELGLSVDYAGLADETCKDFNAGTTFTGKVKEKVLADGRAEVTVKLKTTNAITWVIDGFDFANDTVVFGERWEETEEGDCIFSATPVVGDSFLQVKFINTEPGAPLPDLIQLVFFPDEGQELLEFGLEAEAFGELADGTPAVASTKQLAKQVQGELTFLVERVSIDVIDPDDIP